MPLTKTSRLLQLWFFYPLALVTPLALLGYFDPLLVEPNRYLELLFASLLLIVATVALMVLALHSQRTYLWHYLHNSRKSKTGYILAHLGALLLLAPPAMALGVPSLVHRLSAEPAEQVVTIVGKRANYETPLTCTGKLYIAEYTHLLNDSVCDLPYEQWASAELNDSLVLRGERSLLGFKVTQVRLQGAQTTDTASKLPLFTE